MTTVSYPGVYIEEVPSPVRTIAGVATSITAFIGRARRGPVNDPVRVQSFGEFSRQFGGLWRESLMSYAVQHFFLNGGTDALIVRVHQGGVRAAADFPAGGGTFSLEAASEGEWGDNLLVTFDHQTRDVNEPAPDTDLFNLTVQEVVDGVAVNTEVFRNVSVSDADPRYVVNVLRDQSGLVRVPAGGLPLGARPDVLAAPDPLAPNFPDAAFAVASGDDGGPIGDGEVSNPALEANREGLWALDKADLFNLLCIPPYTEDVDVGAASWTAAKAYCRARRAFVIVDPPNTWQDHTDAVANVDGFRGGEDDYAALYFPRVRMADPLQENRLATFAPCGVVAGIYARTDAARGVWKAPAGQEAQLAGVRALAFKMTDGQNGQLNPLGVNCLRTFPVTGNVVWGARTLDGADRLASPWKYVPVRRLALYIEESLYRGTQWVIFEPNDEPLWAQIRLNVGAFMQNLFRQGAFQGVSARDAYFVKCDSETTTQNDIDLGIVNLLVGFAPLKPAEFLVIKISQIAGEIVT